MKIKECKHLPKKFVGPEAKKCEENHFCPFGQRVCLTCGYVGCCDSCAQHMRKHAQETGHEVMASYPAGEHSFIWCYADDDYLEPDENINLNEMHNKPEDSKEENSITCSKCGLKVNTQDQMEKHKSETMGDSKHQMVSISKKACIDKIVRI